MAAVEAKKDPNALSMAMEKAAAKAIEKSPTNATINEMHALIVKNTVATEYMAEQIESIQSMLRLLAFSGTGTAAKRAVVTKGPAEAAAGGAVKVIANSRLYIRHLVQTDEEFRKIWITPDILESFATTHDQSKNPQEYYAALGFHLWDTCAKNNKDLKKKEELVNIYKQYKDALQSPADQLAKDE